jgi:hypothetical protein
MFRFCDHCPGEFRGEALEATVLDRPLPRTPDTEIHVAITDNAGLVIYCRRCGATPADMLTGLCDRCVAKGGAA